MRRSVSLDMLQPNFIDDRLHYHGADGVYAGVTPEGVLKLYWGESKIYEDAGDAIRACLASLAPYLIEPEHEGAERERDLLLLSDASEQLTDRQRRVAELVERIAGRSRYANSREKARPGAKGTDGGGHRRLSASWTRSPGAPAAELVGGANLI